LSQIINQLKQESNSAGNTGNLIAKIFHPVFLFLYLLLIYYVIYGNGISLPLFLLSLLFTIALPIAFIYFTTDDIYLNDRKKRVLPLLITVSLYFVFYWVSGFFSIPYFLKLYLLSLSIGLFFLILINFNFKISLHGSGIGSFLPFVIFLAFQSGFGLQFWLLSGFSLFAAYLVLRQRLISNSHTLAEVISGFLLGFVISLSVLFFQ
jgi:hypothetical protein